MLIFDGDYPMVAAFGLNVDITASIEESRATEPVGLAGEDLSDIRELIATLPEMRRGRVFAALVKIGARIYRPPGPLPGHRMAAQAYADARGQLAFYEALARQGEIRIIADRASWATHLEEWERLDAGHTADAAPAAPVPIGAIVGMEGADPILDPQHLRDWYELGVRVVSLTHYGISTYAHGTGTGTEGGLRNGANDLLDLMGELGIALDVTHASDRSMLEATDRYDGPLLASHQGCRALVPGERQFSDEMLRRVIEREGVIGVPIDTWMLYRPGVDWTRVTRQRPFSKDTVTLDDFVDHIDHICQLAGHSRCAAIGGDTDGQGGSQGAPKEIDTVADFPRIGERLADRGYGDDDVELIMYRNWVRLFDEVLPG